MEKNIQNWISTNKKEVKEKINYNLEEIKLDLLITDLSAIKSIEIVKNS